MRILSGMILVSVLAAVGCGKSEAVLEFTAIPHTNTTELQRKFEPVAKYLSKALGLRVEYVPSADYRASVEMFKNGDVLLAWFGGLTGVQARHDVPGARAIVQGAEDPEFYSYFIANASTGLTRSDEFPEAIRDLTFTFGSESSTSGHLMPEYFIMQHTGKTAAEFFSHPPAYSGSHNRTADQVQSGAFQAGVMDYSVYDARVREGKIDPERCRIIWKTPTFADYNFTAHPDIDRKFGKGTIDRLQKAFLDMHDPKLLAAFDRSKLIPATNEEYADLEKVAVKLDMLR
jgi:phosphonate transport system substrate-binding protein